MKLETGNRNLIFYLKNSIQYQLFKFLENSSMNRRWASPCQRPDWDSWYLREVVSRADNLSFLNAGLCFAVRIAACSRLHFFNTLPKFKMFKLNIFTYSWPLFLYKATWHRHSKESNFVFFVFRAQFFKTINPRLQHGLKLELRILTFSSESIIGGQSLELGLYILFQSHYLQIKWFLFKRWKL